MEISKTFAKGSYQYSKQPIYEWNPKSIIGFVFTKKKIDSNFSTNKSETISEQEFNSANGSQPETINKFLIKTKKSDGNN